MNIDKCLCLRITWKVDLTSLYNSLKKTMRLRVFLYNVYKVIFYYFLLLRVTSHNACSAFGTKPIHFTIYIMYFVSMHLINSYTTHEIVLLRKVALIWIFILLHQRKYNYRYDNYFGKRLVWILTMNSRTAVRDRATRHRTLYQNIEL